MDCVIDGGEMDAKVMYDEMDRMGVRVIFIQSKGKSGRAAQSKVQSCSRQSMPRKHITLERYAPTAFWAEHVTLNSVTRMSVYELVFAMRGIPVEFAIETYDVVRWKYPMKMEELLAARIRQLERHTFNRTLEPREKEKARKGALREGQGECKERKTCSSGNGAGLGWGDYGEPEEEVCRKMVWAL
jgi:hypothetical protein